MSKGKLTIAIKAVLKHLAKNNVLLTKSNALNALSPRILPQSKLPVTDKAANDIKHNKTTLLDTPKAPLSILENRNQVVQESASSGNEELQFSDNKQSGDNKMTEGLANSELEDIKQLFSKVNKADNIDELVINLMDEMNKDVMQMLGGTEDRMDEDNIRLEDILDMAKSLDIAEQDDANSDMMRQASTVRQTRTVQQSDTKPIEQWAKKTLEADATAMSWGEGGDRDGGYATGKNDEKRNSKGNKKNDAVIDNSRLEGEIRRVVEEEIRKPMAIRLKVSGVVGNTGHAVRYDARKEVEV